MVVGEEESSIGEGRKVPSLSMAWYMKDQKRQDDWDLSMSKR